MEKRSPKSGIKTKDPEYTRIANILCLKMKSIEQTLQRTMGRETYGS